VSWSLLMPQPFSFLISRRLTRSERGDNQNSLEGIVRLCF
jgi:hypothetical protein